MELEGKMEARAITAQWLEGQLWTEEQLSKEFTMGAARRTNAIHREGALSEDGIKRRTWGHKVEAEAQKIGDMSGRRIPTCSCRRPTLLLRIEGDVGRKLTPLSRMS